MAKRGPGSSGWPRRIAIATFVIPNSSAAALTIEDAAYHESFVSAEPSGRTG
jgi:hypothetical protein